MILMRMPIKRFSSKIIIKLFIIFTEYYVNIIFSKLLFKISTKNFIIGKKISKNILLIYSSTILLFLTSRVKTLILNFMTTKRKTSLRLHSQLMRKKLYLLIMSLLKQVNMNFKQYNL